MNQKTNVEYDNDVSEYEDSGEDEDNDVEDIEFENECVNGRPFLIDAYDLTESSNVVRVEKIGGLLNN